jgi:tetratricopeptide (TPR) repeat protein
MKKIRNVLPIVIVTILIITILVVPSISYASFQQAYELYKKGKYYDAEELLLKEKELSPNNLDVYAVLGWCYYYTRRYSAAIEICEEGLKINPKDTRFMTTLGRSYFEFKRYNDAITYFENSIALNPDYAYTYYYLGRVYLDQGKYLLAEAANYNASESDYKKALSLKPNDPKLKEALIRVISKQAEEEADFSAP